MGTGARVISGSSGRAAAVLESSGEWRRVAVAGRKGWVHGDYLRLPDPDAPRPQATVAAARPPKPWGRFLQPNRTAIRYRQAREKEQGAGEPASAWPSADRSRVVAIEPARAQRSTAIANAPTT